MAVHQLDVLAAHQLDGALGDILVGGAMEAVAADGVILVILGGNGVAVSLGGHGHVESGIEHGDLRGVGHDRLTGADAHQVGRVVQGAEGNALFDGGDDLVVDDAGVKELHAAVQDAMADGIDLVGGLDHAVHGIDQNGQNRLNGLGVGGHWDILHDLLAVGVVGQTAVDVDTLTQALGRHGAGLGIHQLILQAGGAGIDNQYIHWGKPPK